ncbi:MAG: hypothetical protein RL199_711, partial [Pseudomonadota bacterium]
MKTRTLVDHIRRGAWLAALVAACARSMPAPVPAAAEDATVASTGEAHSAGGT